jgi:hypothetical protein
MDKGGRVIWEQRKHPGDLSALQHAMHLRIDAGDAVFFAEFQNDPAAGLVGTEDGILHTDLTCKLTRQARGDVPRGTEVLTAFIDVQGKALFYMVVAWARNMTGAIIDYGCEPEQPMRYFTLREVQKTLLKAAPGCGLEAAIRAALDRLTARLLGRAWTVERNGVPLRIEKCLVDAGWGETSDLVYEFCRNSPHAAVLMPSKGVGIAAGRTPLPARTSMPPPSPTTTWAGGSGRRAPTAPSAARRTTIWVARGGALSAPMTTARPAGTPPAPTTW